MVFEQGSQLEEIGSFTFPSVESINLEDCKQLESIGSMAFMGATATINLPASVTKIDKWALEGVDNFTVANPKTPVTADVTGDPSTATYGTATIISKPKVKVSSPNKATVTWSAPKVRTFKNGKATDSKVTYSVKYKVQYRVVGDDSWNNTGYVTGKSKTLTMLAKGQQYEVRVAAYKKNSKGKWVTATTSQKATTAAIKGYNPTPKLKAGKKSVSASWSKVKGATSYKVYYKKSSSKKWSTKTVGKSAKVKLTGLTSKKTYQVKVRAYKGKTGICESTISSITTGTTGAVGLG
ncbi:MAG: fibronectin type III domain-containing protein [Coriobacteriales bacterium]